MTKINEGMFRLETKLDDHDPAHCRAVCSDGRVKIQLAQEGAVRYPMLSKSPISGDLSQSHCKESIKGS